MALTKNYSYNDDQFDSLNINASYGGDVAYIEPIPDGVYIKSESSVPLALNVLGHDRPEDERVSTGVFEIGRRKAMIASSQAERDEQVELAAALLTAADAYDKRAIRLATAEQRRQRALESLANSFAKVNKPATEWTGTDVGKLREALGRYDAELAN